MAQKKMHCTKTVYWHKVKGYSGSLSESAEKMSKGDVVTCVFMKDKTYPIQVALSGSDCADFDITISAVGEDKKRYAVLQAVDVLIDNGNFTKRVFRF